MGRRDGAGAAGVHDELNVGDDEQWSAIKQAATELAEIGLWEFVEATG